jgi:site-specific DNA-adenine methylase
MNEKRFVGSKGGAGVAQWIISAMPAHRVYVEPFLGKGVVLKLKKPAAVSIGIDYDAGVIDNYWCRHSQPGLAIVHGDALAVLPCLKVEPDWLVYADPPYLGSARSCQRRYYRREMFAEAAHERLLSVLTGLQCMVMISGYASSLYAERLASWTVKTFWTVNRRGKRCREFLWMNFTIPAVLHDSRHVGNNFTDRQRIKRKACRWTKKFLAMADHERQAIWDSLAGARILQTEPAIVASIDKKGRADL